MIAPTSQPRHSRWLSVAATLLVVSACGGLARILLDALDIIPRGRLSLAAVGLLSMLAEIALVIGIAKLRASRQPMSASNTSRLRVALWSALGALGIGSLNGLLYAMTPLSPSLWQMLATLATLTLLVAVSLLAWVLADRAGGHARRLAVAVILLLCAEQVVGWTIFAGSSERASLPTRSLLAPHTLELLGYVVLWVLVRRFRQSHLDRASE